MIIILLSIIIYLIYNKIKESSNENIKQQIDKLLINTCKNENFIVADAQDFHNYDKLTAELKKEPNNFDEDTLKNPSDKDIINYDDNIKKPEINQNPENSNGIIPKHTPIPILEENAKKAVPIAKEIDIIDSDKKKIDDSKVKIEDSYVTSIDFGWNAPFPLVSCANSSISEKYKTGPVKLLPMQIACGFPNKLTAENFYKTQYEATPIKLEDYMVRGANYLEYSSYIHPTNLNVRILSHNTKGLPEEDTIYKNIPSGANYAFHNTPAMRMP
jgi:hypothetical protein